MPRLVGLKTVNSVDFVRTVFRLYAERTPFVTLSDSHAGLLPGIEIARTIAPRAGGGWVNVRQSPIEDDALAQVNFTSGTEGEPKGILLSHRALAAVTERLNAVMQLDSSVREYVGVPAYHSFGLGRFRACAAAGGDAFVPEGGFNIAEIAAMLRAGEINALSAVPTLWRVLLANRQTVAPFGDRVRWIEIGSQYMAREEKEALKALFPNARIVQHYGLTEASRSTLLLISDTKGEALESVGEAPEGCEVRVDGSGRIAVRGPHVARHRIGSDGCVALLDGQGWLTTSDLGHVAEGRLYYHGRADDVINCGGIKLSPEAVEARLREVLPGDTLFAVSGMPDALRGAGVFIAVSGATEAELATVRAAARRVLADRFSLSVGDALKVARVEALPVTASGKIRRSALAELAAVATEAADAPETSHGMAGAVAADSPFLAALRKVVDAGDITPEATFFDLGGDSLSAINLMLRMESMDVPKALIRAFLDGASVAEVVAFERAEGAVPEATRRPMLIVSDAINATRGIFVLWLVVLHWLPGIWARLGVPDSINLWMNPAYRLGTPSFAIVFGLTVGFYHFHGLDRGESHRIKRNIW
ncbi:MAG TPA: AMP-binding protein, partial [Sphingomonadaceae bacterium]|nr:AMP-binding protein [Sphingomonadaceae bacterium]